MKQEFIVWAWLKRCIKQVRIYLHSSSVEPQKGAIIIQSCSVENQKGAIQLYKVYGDSALLVLNGTSLNSDSALLVLSLRVIPLLFLSQFQYHVYQSDV